MNEFDGAKPTRIADADPYTGDDKTLMAGFVRSMCDTHMGSCDDCRRGWPCRMVDVYTKVLGRVLSEGGDV